MRLWFIFVTLLFANPVACLPFVVPPARLEVGPAMRRGDIHETNPNAKDAHLVAFRGALHPIGGLKNGDRKPYDVGIGYAIENQASNDTSTGNSRASTIHGPYVEVGAYPLRLPIEEKYAIRAGVYGTVNALVRDNSSESGLGLTVGPLVEFTHNVTGPFSSEDEEGKTAGAASGYWGFGIYGNASYRQFDGHGSYAYSAGVSVRIPFALGVACCAVPTAEGIANASSNVSSDVSSSSSSKRTRATPKPRK
jgi:hypothetical protein